MITIRLTQQIHSGVFEVFNTLLEHDLLARFFDGTFRVIQPSSDPDNVNGAGTIREICMRGETFREQITAAKEGYIEYCILGDKPLKNHKGMIDIKSNSQGCLINYVIECEALWWQPSFIVKRIISRDINVGLIKLAEYFNGRHINSMGN